MRLSIIVPTLNEAANIAATLVPLQPMRARGVEVVVADGGSTDDTRAIAQPLADHMIDCAPGRARQMNAGAGVATGDSLLFLHADSFLPAEADREIAAALSQSQWGRFDVTISGAHAMLPVVAWFMNHRSRLTGIATGDQGLFMTRKMFEGIGGFPDQPLMEDVEISTRLKSISPPACLAARIQTSGRRWEKHGVWKTILLMWWLRLRYFLGASPAEIHRAYYGPAHDS